MTIALITIAVLEIAAAGYLGFAHRGIHRLADQRAQDLAAATSSEDARLKARERNVTLRERALAEQAERVPVLTEVLLSTKKPDDQAIRGLIDLDVRGPVLHLVDAHVIDGENELPAPQLRIERDHVAYMQVL